MRTAEEYLEIYNNSEDKDTAIGRICGAFLQETGFEIKRIPVQYPHVPVEKIREVLVRQNEKWRKFAELVKIVRPEGYEILLQRKAPEFFSVLNGGVFQ